MLLIILQWPMIAFFCNDAVAYRIYYNIRYYYLYIILLLLFFFLVLGNVYDRHPTEYLSM